MSILETSSPKKSGLLSAIKSHFPRKRKNKYKIGYEDLLTDSCSLPSIAEEESQLIADDGQVMQDDNCHQHSDDCHQHNDDCHQYNDDSLGEDSAYDSGSVTDLTDKMGKVSVESRSDTENSTESRLENESGIDSRSIEQPVLLREGTRQSRKMSSDSLPLSDYSVGEVLSSGSSEEEYNYYHSDEMDSSESGLEEQGECRESGILLLRKESPGHGNLPHGHSECDTADHSAEESATDNSWEDMGDDISLGMDDLVSALGMPLYYETVRIKTPPLERAILRNIQEEIGITDSSIFLEARSQASSIIDNEESCDSCEDERRSESLLLVDEIDAFNMKRGMSPTAEMNHERFIDTSIAVFPGDTNDESSHLVNQMFATNSLFCNFVKGDIDPAEIDDVTGDSEGESAAEPPTEYDIDDRFACADSCSLYTDTSTLKRSRCSDTSSMTSLETMVPSGSHQSGSTSSEELYGSYDGSDEDDTSSEISERTYNFRQISWEDEEFIELPAAIKTMWSEDSELFDIVKFLSKWGKYNVIVEGTLDLDDFWEDHIYFQSGRGRDADTDDHYGQGGKGWMKDTVEDEEADCHIVDRLFTLYQQKKLLQFNTLQQKSLYCSPCQSFHIIEII